MCNRVHYGVICRKLDALLFWLWNFLSLGTLMLNSVHASSSVPSSHEPDIRGEARESRSFLGQTTLNPNIPGSHDDEEFPLWQIVLIVVTGGLFLVALILCLIKFHRWKKDRGTYSMWNNQEPSVEAMFARESRVRFERLDIDSSLAEAQCYEIPVDSFETPQRIYIDGVGVPALTENSETPVREWSLSQDDAEIRIIDQTQYCPAKKRTSISTDVTGQRESMPSSVGPDVSQRSSVSTSIISDKVPNSPSSQEPPKELYPKPLPVVPVEDSSPVLCETYTLDVSADCVRASDIAKRPLPQTPYGAPNPAKYCVASLDRSLLKQLKEEKQEKPNISRTLPRPRKLRQLPLPFLNAITRSASSSDVNKEAERLSDHVASDPKKCTLTRIKKRMSQSVGTLLASERVSHFYENPYLVETTSPGEGKGGNPTGNQSEPPYSRVSSIPASSDENLPKHKEHFYTRISQYMDGPENLNRHSYASVHYPSFRSRPKSKHVYISIIFDSAESVCIPSLDDPKTNPRVLSKSCPTLNTYSCPDTKHTPRPNSYYPPTDTPDGLYSINPRDVKTRVPNQATDDSMPFPDCQYQNIRESFGVPPLAKPAVSKHPNVSNNSYQNLQESLETSQNSTEVYNSPKSLGVQPYYENITCIREGTNMENNPGDDIDTSHYGVPKSPPISLNRFCEILGTTSNGKAVDQRNADTKVASDDGDLKIRRRKRDAVNASDKCERNGERETFSTYLEGRFNGEECNGEVETLDKTTPSELSSKNKDNEETYENFISTKRDSCISENSLASSHDRASMSSSLSIDDKEIYENQPLISKTSDVNGNSVGEGCIKKLDVRRSLVESTLCGESVA